MVIPILLSIICTLWLSFIYTGLGYFVFKLIGLSFQSRLLHILAGIALGFCITGNTIMVLCFIQLASPIWIVSALILFTIPGLLFYKHIISDIFYLTRGVVSIGQSANRLAFVLLIILIGGYAVRGLLPPTGFDALMYHLSTIKLYLKHGGFWNIYFNAQSDYPMLTEMNFMIGLVFNNDIICKTISFLLALMSMATIAYISNYYFNDKKIIVPSLLVYTTFTAIIANMSNCDVDIPQALWTIMALIVLEKYLQEQKTSHLIISSIFAGMALQTKIFGVFAIPVVLIRLFMQRRRSLFSLSRIKEVAFLIFIPLLMGLPWYVKSYVYNQTILSIRHSSIVGQGLAAPMGIQCVSKSCYWFVNIIVRIFSAPWTFSVFPGQHCGDTFGPLFIAILPFILFVAIPDRVRIVLAMMGTFLAQIIFMEIWFIQGGTTIRYSMFVLVIGAPLTVWTVSQLNSYLKIQKLLRLIIICVICIGSLIFIKRYHKEWIAFLTFQARDEYYSKALPEYNVINTINKLPKDRVVMPIYNYSDYLLDVPYITAYKRYNSIGEMKKDFKEKNIGYIFANDKLDPSKNRDTYPEVTEKECIDSTNGFYLFKLADTF